MDENTNAITVLTVYKRDAPFTDEYVTRLQRGVSEHLSVPYRFVCLTETPVEGVECLKPNSHFPGWWGKTEIFRPDLPFGRVLYIDLSSIIRGSLDEMVAQDGVVITKDFYHGTPSQSILLYDVGDFEKTWEAFAERPFYWIDGSAAKLPYDFGDQVLMNHTPVPEMRYWQDILPGQVTSFKVNGVTPDARIIKFHGRPKPHEVNWLEHGQRTAVSARAASVLERLDDGPIVGAEVGVFTGKMSEILLQRPDLTLYMVDAWDSAAYQGDTTGQWIADISQDKQNEHRRAAEERVGFAGERAKIIAKRSVDAAKDIPDGSLDFVFIDADHSYEACIEDLKTWHPKLKPSGVLCGHDYGDPAFGVTKAVEEFADAFSLGDDKTYFIKTIRGKKTPSAVRMIRPFMEMCNPHDGLRIIDFGCGDGAVSLRLAELGYRVTGIDHVDLRKKGKRKYKFIQHCLAEPFEMDLRGDYGFCNNVMERIPEEKVDAVLKNIFTCCRNVFFNINFTHNGSVPNINSRLDLMDRQYEWWAKKLESFGQVVDGRDLIHTGIFYCTAGGKEMLTINRETAVIHMKNTLALNFPQISGREPQDKLTLLLAGGPSLNDYIDEIKQKREDGAVLVTCNGTHDWALDHGMVPSIQLIADGRQFNERFVKRAQEKTHYWLSSICHPDVFKALGYSTDPNWGGKKYNVHIWHTGMYPEVLLPMKIKHYFGQNFCLVGGGSTVATRGLALLQLAGFRKIEAYGLDGCYGSDHAYEQKENANETVFPVTVAGREFSCSGWQAAQAQHFIDNVRMGVLDNIELAVHGDGLISWIIESGASGVEGNGGII